MPSASPSASHDTRPFFAMVLRLMAMLFISLMFACAKWVSEHGVHIVETLFYRQLFCLPVVLASLALGPGFGALRTSRLGVHATRSLVGTVGMVLNFGAVILLPLAEAASIGFTVPIFATILSTLFLGERPGVHRWMAVLTGFAGVMLIIGPTGGGVLPSFGVAVAIGAALSTACISLLLRQLGRTESPIATVFYFSVLSLPLLGVGILFFGRAHSPLIWLVMVAMGTFGGAAQILMTAALRWGPVSLVLPMDYSALLWSTILGWLLWNNWPGPWTWVGAVMIAASSLYIAWREHIRRRESISRLSVD